MEKQSPPEVNPCASVASDRAGSGGPSLRRIRVQERSRNLATILRVSFRIAAAQYPVTALESFEAYAAKLNTWFEEAVLGGAKLIVFPEYASLELTAFMEPAGQQDIARQLVELQALLPAVLELHASMARKHGVYALAGSYPVLEGARYLNRAHFFGPDGRMAHQDKIVMTRFEREEWGISGGAELRAFDTEFGRVGVSICYDVEFPLIVRALCDSGADLLLVPSCTQFESGYQRVRVGARARALENQCYAVQSPLIGQAPWTYALEQATGAAGVFAPIESRFSDDGVIAEGVTDAPGWVYADLDLEALRESRRDGETLNSRDWNESATIGGVKVSLEKF